MTDMMTPTATVEAKSVAHIAKLEEAKAKELATKLD